MGTKELREAFNLAADGRYACNVATLGYEHSDGTEWQILSFSGTDASGAPFMAQSERLRAGTNVMQAARDTALALVDKGKPK